MTSEFEDDGNGATREPLDARDAVTCSKSAPVQFKVRPDNAESETPIDYAEPSILDKKARAASRAQIGPERLITLVSSSLQEGQMIVVGVR
jgi:hypothetical protein